MHPGLGPGADLLAASGQSWRLNETMEEGAVRPPRGGDPDAQPGIKRVVAGHRHRPPGDVHGRDGATPPPAGATVGRGRGGHTPAPHAWEPIPATASSQRTTQALATLLQRTPRSAARTGSHRGVERGARREPAPLADAESAQPGRGLRGCARAHGERAELRAQLPLQQREPADTRAIPGKRKRWQSRIAPQRVLVADLMLDAAALALGSASLRRRPPGPSPHRETHPPGARIRQRGEDARRHSRQPRTPSAPGAGSPRALGTAGSRGSSRRRAGLLDGIERRAQNEAPPARSSSISYGSGAVP